MKKLAYSISVFLLLAACNQQEDSSPVADQPNTEETKAEAANPSSGVLTATKPDAITTIQWIDSAKQIGKVTEGEKVEITFRFKNTGENQLVIQNVMASCGCTVAQKPDQPIAPGAEGMIKAAFDSKGRVGTNHKTLTIYANTPQPTHTVYFEVEVEKKN